MRKIVSSMMLALILISVPTIAFGIRSDKAYSRVRLYTPVYIRADGSIDPSNAPIISSDNLTYTLTDNIEISYVSGRTWGLVIERDNIIIDGAGHAIEGWMFGTGIYLSGRTNVTIRNTQIKNFEYGIYLDDFCSSISINKNNITNYCYGIILSSSSKNIISGNNIITKYGTSIGLSGSSNNNFIIGNNIANSVGGIGLWGSSSNNNFIIGNILINNSIAIRLDSSNNLFYHNNFINNTQQVYITEYGVVNVWDNGYPSGGNYWSDYRGVDYYSGPYQNETGGDGIGDTAYIINGYNADRYPLMAPFRAFDAGVWNGTEYFVDVISNSTVSGFVFDPSKGPYLKFNVTGDDGTIGFCRVTISKSLLWAEDGWTITINNQQITNYTEIEDENNTYLYFTYRHSTKTVTIQGTHIIPELSPAPILLLFTIISTIVITLRKRIRRKQN